MMPHGCPSRPNGPRCPATFPWRVASTTLSVVTGTEIVRDACPWLNVTFPLREEDGFAANLEAPATRALRLGPDADAVAGLAPDTDPLAETGRRVADDGDLGPVAGRVGQHRGVVLPEHPCRYGHPGRGELQALNGDATEGVREVRPAVPVPDGGDLVCRVVPAEDGGTARVGAGRCGAETARCVNIR